MPKKIQFLITSGILTLLLIFQLETPPVFQPFIIGAIFIISYLLTAYVLSYDLAGIEYLTIMALPVLFTTAISATLHYFPNFSLLFNTILLAVYFLSLYLILLSENIFNVGRDKPIPLIKAASTVSFLTTLLTTFLLYTIIYKADIPVVLQWVGIFFTTFLLAIQSLWTISLGTAVSKELIAVSLFLALLQLELAVSVSFFALEAFFWALFLSTSFYVFLGTAFHYFKKSLTNKVFIEYLLIGIFVVGIIVII